MSISFNTPKLGPLGQIGLELLDATTVVCLATRAYGWYKSRERTLTLEQALASDGISLVGVSTFNRRKYDHIRNERGNVSGLARIRAGPLVRVQLPEASTATEGDPGFVCLRALTQGLLCLIDPTQVLVILKAVVPCYLFQTDQERKERVGRGPCLDALKNYIEAVSTEESMNQLQNDMRELASTQVHRVSSADPKDLLSCPKTEISHIVKLLEWTLTPARDRKSTIYYTRSLQVWTLALVLSEIGFNIEATRTPLKQAFSQDAFRSFASSQHTNVAEAILVLTEGWPTDQGNRDTLSKRWYLPIEIETPPRVVPVSAYPSLSYPRYVSRAAKNLPEPLLDAKVFRNAFDGTHTLTRSQLSKYPALYHVAGLKPPIPYDVCKEPSREERETAQEIIRYFLGPLVALNESDWLELVFETLTKPILQYFLPWCGGRDSWRSCDSEGEAMMDQIVFSALMTGISLFVRSVDTDHSELQLHFEFVYRGPSYEKPASYGWFISFAKKISALFKTTDIRRFGEGWTELLVEILTGKTAEDSKYLNGSIYGGQHGGLAVVSASLLQPPTPSLRLVHYVAQGRLLDFPTVDGFILSGLICDMLTIHIDKSNALIDRKMVEYCLTNSSFLPSSSHLRMDVEPCWDYDGQTCCFKFRLDGMDRFDFSISTVLDSLPHYQESVLCGEHPNSLCPGPQTILALLFFDGPTSDIRRRWYNLPLEWMVREGRMVVASIDELPLKEEAECDDRYSVNWIVNVHDRDSLVRLACLCSFSKSVWPGKIIITNCLGAALLASTKHYSVFIIIYKEKHNRLLEESSPSPDGQYDLLTSAMYLAWPPDLRDPSEAMNMQDCYHAAQLLDSFYGAKSDRGFGLRIIAALEKPGRGAYLAISRSGTLDILKALADDEIAQSIKNQGQEQSWPDSPIEKRVLELIHEWRNKNPSFEASELAVEPFSRSPTANVENSSIRTRIFLGPQSVDL